LTDEPLTSSRLALKVHPECTEDVHRLLREFWIEIPDLDEVWRMAFTTALVEVVNNIIMYCGHRGGPCSMRVELRAYPDRVEAEVHDNGEPVSLPAEPQWPESPLAERGRGLAIVRMTVDDFRYDRQVGDNRWLVVKRR
jgi:serine/threonine-protein kinase RsbW